MRANVPSRLPRQRPGQHRLADPRHIFDQYVPLDQQCGERKYRRLRLAHDDLCDVGLEGFGELGEVHECLVMRDA